MMKKLNDGWFLVKLHQARKEKKNQSIRIILVTGSSWLMVNGSLASMKKDVIFRKLLSVSQTLTRGANE